MVRERGLLRLSIQMGSPVTQPVTVWSHIWPRGTIQPYQSTCLRFKDFFFFSIYLIYPSAGFSRQGFSCVIALA